MQPTVSVIIPAYNTEDYIGKAMASVLTQSLQNIEVIVIDDCSTDGTLKEVKKFSDDRVVVISNKKNIGVSASRNLGLKIARGEWISLLDSDDWFDQVRLERMVDVALTTKADIVSDEILNIREGEVQPWSAEFRCRGIQGNGPREIGLIDYLNFELGMQPIFKREFLEKNHLKFDQNLRYGEDFKMFVECLLAGARWYIFFEGLYYYLERKNSSISNQVDMATQVKKILIEFIDSCIDGDNVKYIEAFLNKKKRVEQTFRYYTVVEPFKKKKIIFGLKKLIEDPLVMFLIFKNFKKILKHRV